MERFHSLKSIEENRSRQSMFCAYMRKRQTMSPEGSEGIPLGDAFGGPNHMLGG